MYLVIFSALLSLCSVSAAPWKNDVTMEELYLGLTLPKGDRIQLIEEENLNLPTDRFDIILQLVAPVTKWKSIVLHSHGDNSYTHTMVELEANQIPFQVIMRTGMLVVNDLVLWKDELVGKAAYYRVIDAREGMKPQHIYTFQWIKD